MVPLPDIEIETHVVAVALKFFRSCIGLQDEEYNNHFIQRNHIAPILDIVYSTMPRDNLLNSACLDLFEFIRHTNMRPLIEHIVINHRAKLQDINYVDTFQNLVVKYEQILHPPPPTQDMTLFSNDGLPEERKGIVNGGHRWQGMKEMDAAEQAYFEDSDDDEDVDDHLPTKRPKLSESPMTNGLEASPDIKSSLVDYPDDDEDDLSALPSHRPHANHNYPRLAPSPVLQTPPERFSEKRRREEDDDEDELGKLSTTTKRRNALQSSSPIQSHTHNNSALRRKKSFFTSKEKEPPPPDSVSGEAKKKIAISLGNVAGPKTPPPQSEEEDKMEEDG